MKRVVRVLLSFICLFVFFASSDIEAKTVLKSEKAVNYNQEVIGQINLNDDYTIDFVYLYRVKNINILVCKIDECDEAEPQIDTKERSYINGEEATFSLVEYLDSNQNNTTYRIIASAKFSPSINSSGYNADVRLEYDLVANDIVKDSERDEEVFTSVDKVVNVVNTWVIPIIYIALAVAIVIKSILLAIDIIRYSSYPDIRREKIRSYIYIAIGIFLVAIINSCVGFITGLFG